jgi:hypothetical protein
MPEQPNSRPLSNFDSDPGKIEKLSIFKFSKRLYELSLTPTIFFGYFFTSFLTQLTLNL